MNDETGRRPMSALYKTDPLQNAGALGFPKLNYVLLARQVIANAQSGNPTFVEVFSQVRPPIIPFVTGDFFIVLCMSEVTRPIDITVVVSTEADKKPLWIGNLPLQVPPLQPVNAANIVYGAVGVDRISIDTPGNLTLQISFEAIEVFTQLIPVTLGTASSTAIVDI